MTHTRAPWGKWFFHKQSANKEGRCGSCEIFYLATDVEPVMEEVEKFLEVIAMSDLGVKKEPGLSYVIAVFDAINVNRGVAIDLLSRLRARERTQDV